MLSILIPTYNYNVLPLVQVLQQQALQAQIEYEIIVLDDASDNTAFIAQNTAINLLQNCIYEMLRINIGRSAIRNLLAKKAKYSWLLYLDADTMPAHSNFITSYLPYLNEEEKIVYGGIKYQEEKPQDNMLLRWVYGNEREALSSDKRIASPHKSLLTLNFAIKKSVFDKVGFNEEIPNLRHEDTLFSYELERESINVQHVDNAVYHLGLDTSEIFIKKSEEAVVGLKYLLDHNLLSPGYARISRMYYKIKALGLCGIIAFIYNQLNHTLKKNLLSHNPSMLVFDLYRLGYLCSLK